MTIYTALNVKKNVKNKNNLRSPDFYNCMLKNEKKDVETRIYCIDYDQTFHFYDGKLPTYTNQAVIIL